MSRTGTRLLLVEENQEHRRVTESHLQRSGHQVVSAADTLQALDILSSEHVDLVLSDLSSSESGIDLLRRIRSEHQNVPVIIMAEHGTVETALQAMKAGAHDYVTRPVHPDELELVIDRALEHRHLVEEVKYLRSALDGCGFEAIIGRSPNLLEVLDSAARVAPTDSTVLVLGETGTGKGLLTKAIHYNSPRRERPFVSINCAAIPRELLESELFGFVKGAFTGAIAPKKGRVEVAEGGTVFLDEIGEMPLDLQVRLLRLIEEREIEKVGAVSAMKVDVRIIAATHRSLENLVSAGEFREDLYYRLAVVPILMPPLRERAEDIPALLEDFFERSKERHGRPEKRLPSSLVPLFTGYHWPGNVRELQNVTERIVLLSAGDVIDVSDLPVFLREGSTLTPPEPPATTLGGVERNLIVDALRRFEWNQSQAARHLAISRKALMYRIAKYGIEKEYSEPER